jgi:outer membrane protein assembly factor BamB
VGWVWEDWGEPGALYASTVSGHVRKLAVSGGTAPPTQVWARAVAGVSAPAVLVAQGLLWVGSSDGKVHQLRLSDGVDEKQVTVGDGTAAVGTPTWDGASGWLYVGTAAGKVFAIPTPLP